MSKRITVRCDSRITRGARRCPAFVHLTIDVCLEPEDLRELEQRGWSLATDESASDLCPVHNRLDVHPDQMTLFEDAL